MKKVSPDRLPRRVIQTAADQELGAFKEIYTPDLVGCVIAAGGIFFTVAAFLALFAYGIVKKPVDWAIILSSGIPLPAFLCLGSFIIYCALEAITRHVYVFQKGMVIKQRRQVESFPWNQASDFQWSSRSQYREGTYMGETYSGFVRRKDGYMLMLDEFTKDVTRLADTIRSGIREVSLPPVQHVQPSRGTICTFRESLPIDPERFRESGVALVECPDCKAVRTLSSQSGVLQFKSHYKRKMATPNTRKRWTRGEAEWNVIGDEVGIVMKQIEGAHL